MAAIVIKAFSGLKPMINPVLLETSDATVASNVRLVSGALNPLKGTTTLKALTKTAPATIFRYGTSATETQYWLEFLSDTDVANSPIPNDSFGRLYWTDGGTPKYAPNTLVLSGADYPGGSYTLGIPAPSAVPAVAGSAPTSTSTETRVYTYTYVSAYGEEGPPASPTAVTTLDPSQSVSLTGMSVAPAGSYNISTKRIYRSSTVGTAAQYQFVAEIPVANTSYTDTKTQAELGEVLPSTTWVAPPSGLMGLKVMANGVAVGFKDNTVYLSEPNLPHAWPNQYPVDLQVVGLSPFRQSVAILTTGHPYLMSGADPAAMTLERLEFPHACLSKRSIVDTGDGCLYAGADGVVSIGAGGMKVVTSQIFDRSQWQAYNPSSMSAFFHDGRYHVLYTTGGGTRGMLIFDFSGQGSVLTVSDINTATAITAGYSDARTDTLYFAQGTNIVRFNAGSSLTYTWRSKTFRSPFAMNFSKAQVIASAYPVTFKWYGNGVLRHTKTVADANLFQLPSGYRDLDFQVEVSGSSEITQVTVATSADEIRAT